MLRVATTIAQAILQKYDGPTSYRTTQYDEIRTIACGHFVRRTSVFYTRTIACAVACGSAIACGDPCYESAKKI